MGAGRGQEALGSSCFWEFESSLVWEFQLFQEFSEIRDFEVLSSLFRD